MKSVPLVIFLDVDGVLNSFQTTDRIPDNGCIGLDEDKCQLFREAVLRTDAQIVLSSTWRLKGSTRRYLWKRLGEDMEHRCIGQTPAGKRDEITGLYTSLSRGGEIQAWLDAWPRVGRFLILDDCPIEGPLKERHIRTCMDIGLTKEHAERII